jgi:hypothetical protein
MGRKMKIAVVAGVLALLLAAVGAYAYDGSQKDQIADGVTIGGVDVGGMSESQAKRAVRAQLLAPLRHSLRVGSRVRASRCMRTSMRPSRMPSPPAAKERCPGGSSAT